MVWRIVASGSRKSWIEFFNDSKGTNVGATLAALKGLATDYGRIVLIAGGVGKGADFSPSGSGVRAFTCIGIDR